ncbi:MAG: ATP-binding protein [Bacteroidota bacterium]|nr:ATP-binding protein [Bacteroidota bacterium]
MYRGAGLGLAISKHVLKLGGGDIKVESEEGKGAAFIFYLPMENLYETQNI